MSWPVQLRITYPHDAWRDDLDPSKLTLMNPSSGFFHAISNMFSLGWGLTKVGLGVGLIV